MIESAFILNFIGIFIQSVAVVLGFRVLFSEEYDKRTSKQKRRFERKKEILTFSLVISGMILQLLGLMLDFMA